MAEQKDYAKALEKYAEEVLNDKNREISQLLQENSKPQEHIMLIEEKKFEYVQKCMKKLENENALLEKVDLIDYWKLENGRTNKTW